MYLCMCMYVRNYVYLYVCMCTRGADKSLARPISLCRRARWKEGFVYMPNCRSFLVTEAEREHVRRRARF